MCSARKKRHCHCQITVEVLRLKNSIWRIQQWIVHKSIHVSLTTCPAGAFRWAFSGIDISQGLDWEPPWICPLIFSWFDYFLTKTLRVNSNVINNISYICCIAEYNTYTHKLYLCQKIFSYYISHWMIQNSAPISLKKNADLLFSNFSFKKEHDW